MTRSVQQAAAEGRWEHFPHGADVGIRGIGATPDVAFEQAAYALTAVVSDPAKVAPEVGIELRCQAPDLELLLAEWLNDLVYEMATRGMLFGRFSVRISGARLDGQAWGEPVSTARHQPAAEVKGATYTALQVTQRGNGDWVAQCVVDV